MIDFHGWGYGDNRLELKRDIAEAVRGAMRPNLNVESFYDVRHWITPSPAPEKGKWRIDIHVYVLHKPDRRLPLVPLFQWLYRWKYRLAMTQDSLTLWDLICLYGLRPRRDSLKSLGEIERHARTTTPQ